MAALLAIKKLKRSYSDASFTDVMRDVGQRAQAMPMAKKIKSTTLSFAVALASATDKPAQGDKPASIETRVYMLDLRPLNSVIPRVRVEGSGPDDDDVPLITVDPAGEYFDVNVAVEHRPNPNKPQIKGHPQKDDVFHRLARPERVHRNTGLFLFVNGALGKEISGDAQGAILGGLSYETFLAKDGSRRYSWRASALNVMTDADAYAWAYTSRMRYVFPYGQQLLPVPANIGKLLWGFDLAELQAAQGLPKNSKTKNAYETFGYTLPVFRLEVAQIGGRYCLPSEQYLLTHKTKGQGMSAALGEPLAMCRHVTMEQAPTPPATTRLMFGMDSFEVLRLLVTIARARAADAAADAADGEVKVEGTAEEGDTEEKVDVAQILVEAKVFAHHLINAPVRVPSWNAALIGGTATRPPMPFTLLLKPDPVRSHGDTRVLSDAPDGILHAGIERLVFELRRYVLQYGIPLTTEAVTKGLFAPNAQRGSCFDETLGTDDTIETIMEDAFPAGKFDDYEKMAVIDYASPLNNEEGVVVLDVANKLNFAHRAWSTPGIRFFAVPLTDDVAVPLETDPTADPTGELAAIDADLVPQRCALRTPEAGNAHLLEALKAAQVFKPDAPDLVAACKDPLRPFVVDYAVERNRDLVRDDLRDLTKKVFLARPYFLTMAVFPKDGDDPCALVDLGDKITKDYFAHQPAPAAAAAAVPAVTPLATSNTPEVAEAPTAAPAASATPVAPVDAMEQDDPRA